MENKKSGIKMEKICPNAQKDIEICFVPVKSGAKSAEEAAGEFVKEYLRERRRLFYVD